MALESGNMLKGGRHGKNIYFLIFLKQSLGRTKHMKKLSDFSSLSSLPNLGLNLAFFLLPVCVEIQTYCGCGFTYIIERTPTRAPCLLAVWLLRAPTHIATVLAIVFLRSLGIHV